MKPAFLLGIFCVGLGVLGYAFAGHPELPEVPAPTFHEDFHYEPAAETAARELFEKFSAAQGWIIMSNALIRGGRTEIAVHALRSGLEEVPANADLWTQMGVALVAHAEGEVVPAARLAFSRARLLAPASPAPDYFLGLAYYQAGDVARALDHWRPLAKLAKTAPPDEKWAQMLAGQMAIACRMLGAEASEKAV